MRLLLVKLSSLGDVMHTTYALSDAMAARPGLKVDWLVEEAFADLAGLHPAVDQVIPVRLRGIRKGTSRLSGLMSHSRELKRQLRAKRYDAVIDAQGLLKSALLARLAGRPVSGPNGASAREGAASLFYRHRFESPLMQHAATRTRRLLADALDYDLGELPLRSGLQSDGLRAQGQATLRQMGLSGRSLLLVHGSAWQTKTWDPERWRSIVALAGEQGHSVIIPAGNDEERAVAGQIAEGAPHARVLPAMGLMELVPLIAACAGFAGVDSGLSHLAEALELPGAMLMGPTDPVRTGPLGPGVATILSSYQTAPCYRREAPESESGRCCMDGVSVGAVAEALLPVLQPVEQPGGVPGRAVSG
jgi:heptosyltransferase-1